MISCHASDLKEELNGNNHKENENDKNLDEAYGAQLKWKLRKSEKLTNEEVNDEFLAIIKDANPSKSSTSGE